MAGISRQIEVEGMEDVQRRLAGLSAFDVGEAMFAIGVLLEGSTKERIDSVKATADGTPWAAWSDAHGATRTGAHSLLIESGSLQESIQAVTSQGEVAVGTNLVYAAAHQFGRDEIGLPARPYLGVSEEDADDIRDLIFGGLEEAGR